MLDGDLFTYRVHERLVGEGKKRCIEKGIRSLIDLGQDSIDILLEMGAISEVSDSLPGTEQPRHGHRPFGYIVGQRRYQKGKLQGPPGWWESIGELQFQFLIDHGLKRDHNLLDIGCGTFRAGRLLIDYLDEERYHGFDRWQEALDIGVEKVLEPEGLMPKRPKFAQVEILDTPIQLRDTFPETSFDVVWAHSVLVSLGPPETKALLESVSDVLADGGVFYATAFVSDEQHVRWGETGHIRTHIDCQFWHYSLDFLESAIKDAGMLLSNVLEYDHPYQMNILEMARNIGKGGGRNAQ